MLNGFGLQKLGIAAIRFPLASTLLVALVTLAAVFGLTRIQFSGENIEILRDGSQELKDYDELLSSFRDFNNDAVLLMRIDNLATVEGIETFRDLNFEFQLDPRVQSVLSIFSLVRLDPVQGWQSAIPAQFDNDAEVLAALQKLANEIPSSTGLFSQSYDSAVIVVYTKPEAVQDSNVRETMHDFADIASSFDTDTIKVSIAGQPAIRSDLIDSIVSDLIVLAPIAFLFCAILAFALFRQPVAMVLCALPSLLSTLWFLGGTGLAGVPLNFLTNILPVLIIVVVFADTLHLYLKWQKIARRESDGYVSLKLAIEEIGPACALSSMTTAVALLSLCASGNNGLFQLGIIGAIAILAGFLSVIIAMPVAALWFTRAGFVPQQPAATKLSAFTRLAMAQLKYRKTVIIAGLVLCGAGLFAHMQIDSRFRLIDYLGDQSLVSRSEGYIDQTYSGTTPLFAIVETDANFPLDHEANRQRLYKTIEGIEQVFPTGSFYSLADFAKEIEKAGGKLDEALIDEIPEELSSRFISADRNKVLVTMFASANLAASETQEQLALLKQGLEAQGVSGFVKISGYPVLSGVVAPRLMDNLRISLLLAVLFSIIIVAIAARSIRLGLSCLVPNLLPIVCVELILYLAGVPLNMSITVALTVAFGIAVDDSIHMLNQYLINRQHHDNVPAVAGAIKEVTPAFFSTTLILSGGLLIMGFSSLPAMSVFAVVMILTLVFAFLADILQLPAYLAVLKSDNKAAV
ncbi:MAG: MMPL family transporter [Rhizobiaceae bacterium]|nr:MMPL family transporter [Rhizobiaceae bacterium]